MKLPDFIRRFTHRRLHHLHLRNVASIAQADGRLDADEEDLLGRMAEKYHLPRRTAAVLSRRSPGRSAVHITDPDERTHMLYEMILMILADGKVDDAEIDACRRYADEIEFPAEDIEPLIAALQNKPLSKSIHLGSDRKARTTYQ